MFWTGLKVEGNFSSQRARGHVVSAAERGEEIVQCHFIGDVDDREASAPTVAIAVKQVVVPDRKVKQVAWGNARWIVVVVLGTWRWYL